MTAVEFSFEEYPYNHDGQSLGFTVDAYRLDDGDPEDVETEGRLTLFDIAGWETVTLEVSLTVEQETLDHVFADPNDHDGVLVVTGFCRPTHGRFVEPVMWDGFEKGEYTAEIQLNRCDFRERVSLTPKLLLNSGRPEDDEYASDAGRELATGPTWDLYFDEPTLGLKGDLPVDAARFSERPDLGEETNEWYVDTRNAEAPKLWVNKDHPYVVDVLNRVNKRDKRGHVGRVVLNHLAVSMLTQFTIKAAQHAVINNGIKHRWQETLLTDVCRECFGAEPTIDEIEERLRLEEISQTINQIEGIIQRRRTPHEDVQSLLGVIGGE